MCSCSTAASLAVQLWHTHLSSTEFAGSIVPIDYGMGCRAHTAATLRCRDAENVGVDCAAIWCVVHEDAVCLDTTRASKDVFVSAKACEEATYEQPSNVPCRRATGAEYPAGDYCAQWTIMTQKTHSRSVKKLDYEWLRWCYVDRDSGLGSFELDELYKFKTPFDITNPTLVPSFRACHADDVLKRDFGEGNLQAFVRASSHGAPLRCDATPPWAALDSVLVFCPAAAMTLGAFVRSLAFLYDQIEYSQPWFYDTSKYMKGPPTLTVDDLIFPGTELSHRVTSFFRSAMYRLACSIGLYHDSGNLRQDVTHITRTQSVDECALQCRYNCSHFVLRWRRDDSWHTCAHASTEDAAREVYTTMYGKSTTYDALLFYEKRFNERLLTKEQDTYDTFIRVTNIVATPLKWLRTAYLNRVPQPVVHLTPIASTQDSSASLRSRNVLSTRWSVVPEVVDIADIIPMLKQRMNEMANTDEYEIPEAAVYLLQSSLIFNTQMPRIAHSADAEIYDRPFINCDTSTCVDSVFFHRQCVGPHDSLYPIGLCHSPGVDAFTIDDKIAASCTVNEQQFVVIDGRVIKVVVLGSLLDFDHVETSMSENFDASWSVNSDAAPSYLDGWNDVGFHSGYLARAVRFFATHFNARATDICSMVGPTTCGDRAHPNTIIFTGYSQGASVAAMMALLCARYYASQAWFSAKIEVHLFAPPPAFTHAATSLFQQYGIKLYLYASYLDAVVFATQIAATPFTGLTLPVPDVAYIRTPSNRYCVGLTRAESEFCLAPYLISGIDTSALTVPQLLVSTLTISAHWNFLLEIAAFSRKALKRPDVATAIATRITNRVGVPVLTPCVYPSRMTVMTAFSCIRTSPCANDVELSGAVWRLNFFQNVMKTCDVKRFDSLCNGMMTHRMPVKTVPSCVDNDALPMGYTDSTEVDLHYVLSNFTGMHGNVSMAPLYMRTSSNGLYPCRFVPCVDLCEKKPSFYGSVDTLYDFTYGDACAFSCQRCYTDVIRTPDTAHCPHTKANSEEASGVPYITV